MKQKELKKRGRERIAEGERKTVYGTEREERTRTNYAH